MLSAAAYRTASLIQCERDGTTQTTAAEASLIVAPPGADWAQHPAALWNAVEAAEKRRCDDLGGAERTRAGRKQEMLRHEDRSREDKLASSMPASAPEYKPNLVGGSSYITIRGSAPRLRG